MKKGLLILLRFMVTLEEQLGVGVDERSHSQRHFLSVTGCVNTPKGVEYVKCSSTFWRESLAENLRIRGKKALSTKDASLEGSWLREGRNATAGANEPDGG